MGIRQVSCFLGSGPKRGRSPVEWGEILYARLSVRPPLASPQTPLAGPQTPPVGPQTPLAGPQTPLAGPQTPLAGPKTPLAGPQTILAGSQTTLADPQTPLAGPQTPLAGPQTETRESRALSSLETKALFRKNQLKKIIEKRVKTICLKTS